MRAVVVSLIVWWAAAPLMGAEAASRIDALLEQAEQAESADPARAWNLAQEARGLARTPRDELRVGVAVVALLRLRGEYAAALAQARAGRERAQALGERALEAEFLLLQARTQWSRSELPASLESFHALLPLAEGLADPQLLARVHNGIANTQATAGQWDRALSHYGIARGYARQAGDRATLADVLNNLGNFEFNRRKDYAAARELHLEALALREAIGHRRGLADSSLNLGNIAHETGAYAEAIGHFERARTEYETLGLKRNLANALRSLGAALRQSHQPAEAIARLQAGRQLAETLGSAAVIAPIYRELALAHEALHQPQAALEFERKHAAANDAMLNERTRQQIVTLNERAEAERHQREVNLLRREQAVQEAELAQSRWQRVGLLAVLAFGAVAVVALVSRQRLKLAAERRLLEETRGAKEAAEEVAALKTRLVGIASHDLKSPLRGIVLGAGEIAGHPRTPPELVACARLMAKEGERLQALIRDLLDMAALEARHVQLQRAPVALGELVAESVAAAQPRAAEKSQTLAFAPVSDEGAALVSADRGRLRQVLDNLIDNALKFTPAGGRIDLTVSAVDGAAQVIVRDEGPGLTPEDFAQLFQPFRTLSAAPTGGESSSGLGLFIVREIVALHRGQLLVDSAPGQGATFCVKLPLADG